MNNAKKIYAITQRCSYVGKLKFVYGVFETKSNAQAFCKSPVLNYVNFDPWSNDNTYASIEELVGFKKMRSLLKYLARYNGLKLTSMSLKNYTFDKHKSYSRRWVDLKSFVNMSPIEIFKVNCRYYGILDLYSGDHQEVFEEYEKFGLYFR